PFGAAVVSAVAVLFWRSLLGAGGGGWLGAGVVTFGVLYVVSLVLLAPAMAEQAADHILRACEVAACASS
ncbi:MAG: hypothetical protein AAFR28_19625, partial [Pseudomonadota bacterium]